MWRCQQAGEDVPLDKGSVALLEADFLSSFPSCFFFPHRPLCLFLCQTTSFCCSFLMSLHFLSSVMRRNPFGVDICCRKGSRSPLQELYNPTQVSPGNFLAFLAWSPCISFWRRGENESLQNLVLAEFEISWHCLAFYLQWSFSWSPLFRVMALNSSDQNLEFEKPFGIVLD